jgi:glutamate-1-semialdehyde 2,1-aminomutase
MDHTQLEQWLETYAEQRPKSRAIYAELRERVAGGVGHDLRHSPVTPIYIARAVGARKWDIDGNVYLDFGMGNAALLTGHADPVVLDAVREAVGAGLHFGNDHPRMVDWVRLITELIPSAEQVRFVGTGTEGTMLAMRLARAFTGRSRVARLEGHFGGWHDYVGVGSSPPFDVPVTPGIPPGTLQSVVIVPADLNAIEDTLKRDRDIAAIMLEPSGGSWGTVPLTIAFNQRLCALAARYEVLVIYDEVITGFRYSAGGYQRLAGVRPDLTVLGKIVAGGLPGAAIAGRAAIMRQFEYTGDARHDRFARVFHQGTHNANPLSTAAGVAMLRQVADGGPQAHADRMADRLRRGIERVLEELGAAAFVYGDSSTFHVYMEAHPSVGAGTATRERRDGTRGAAGRESVMTTDPARLKGIPGRVVTAFQKNLQIRGMDLLSYTGGVTSSAHTESDIEQALGILRETMQALIAEKLVARV